MAHGEKREESERHYNLDFYLGSRPGYQINPLDVQVGGVTIATGVAPANDGLGTGWTEFSYAFVATSSSTSVGFFGSDPAGGDLDTVIDNVSVTATPEPAPFAALGIGALGLVLRRRASTRN